MNLGAGTERSGRASMPPLSGRDEELRLAVTAVRAGGCVIAGPAGIGKSLLAMHAAIEVSDDVARVVGSPANASVPFGAFTHLLPTGSDAVNPIPALIDSLRRRQLDGPTVLVVDDAHLLDDPSAALTQAVATTGAALLVVTARSADPAPDAVVALWKERWIDRIDLLPLSPRDVRHLVDTQLGDPADPNVYERIFELTQGNPLYVRELVTDARRTGALGRQDGRWSWQSDRVASSRLYDLIDLRTLGVSGSARRVLEILALGAPLTLDHLGRLAARGDLEELERAGLAAMVGSPGAGAHVELAHPMYGEIIAARCSPDTARSVRLELAGALAGKGHLSDSEQLRVATWLLEAGERAPDEFVSASEVALRRGDPALAHRLAVSGGGLHLESALALARTRIALARFDEAESALTPYEADAANAPADVAATYVELRFRAMLRGSSGADAALSFLGRCEAWHDGTEWDALVTTQKGWSALYRGHPLRARGLIEDVRSAPRVGVERRFEALALGAYVYGRLGLTDDADALDHDLQDLAHTMPRGPWEKEFAPFLVDSVSRLPAGRDLTGMWQRIEDACDRARRHGNRALVTALRELLGTLCLFKGHARPAIEHLGGVADELAVSDPLNQLPWTLCSLTTAYALVGDAAAATGALEGAALATSGRKSQRRRLRPEIDRAKAWREVVRGSLPGAKAHLEAVVAYSDEDPEGLVDAIHALVRLGMATPMQVRLLEACAAASQNELWRMHATHARAAADQDPNRLLEAARSYEALGIDLLAAEAASAAAEYFERKGRSDRARRAGIAARRGLARCAGVRTPGLRPLPEIPNLTAREREVVDLVARGLTNAQIGTALFLSVRSVETYLLRMYRKMGVENRGDLAQLAGSPKNGL